MTAVTPKNRPTWRDWRFWVRWDLISLIVLLCVPLVFSDTRGGQMADIFVFAILALALNVMVGYTGLLHLGIGAFFGIGAYIAGILTVRAYPFQVGFGTSLLFAAAGTALAGLILGAPTLRLRGDYLALVTLGFGEMVKVTLRNLEAITAGTQSLGPVPPPAAGFITSDRPYYYLFLAILAAVVLLLRNLEHSRLGRAWIALREDELAATCMAINVPRVKLAAFALSAGLAGLAGCLYVTHLTNTGNPEDYGFPLSITMLCCIILGGLGSIRGVLLGVLLLEGYEFIFAPQLDLWVQGFRTHVIHWLTTSFPHGFPAQGAAIDKVQYVLSFSNWKLMIFGVVLILMVRFRPEGLLPSRRVQHEMEESGK